MNKDQKQFPFGLGQLGLGQRVLCVDPENTRYHQTGRIINLFITFVNEYCTVQWEDKSMTTFSSNDCPLQEHP